MKDFIYHAPTEVVFGKESEEQVARLVKKYGGHKVLVHYGGSSAKRSGLLDKICGLLREGGLDIVLLGGVVPAGDGPDVTRAWDSSRMDERIREVAVVGEET